MRSRARNICRAAALLLLLSLTISLFACADKTYGHCEMILELPDSFKDYDSQGVYDAAYSDGSVIVGILRLSYEACIADDIPTTLSPRRFAEYYYTELVGGLGEPSVRESGDVPYYTYLAMSEGGASFTYMPTFYITPYAYFIVTYIVPTAMFEDKQPELLRYAEGARITGNYEEKAAR